jgi:hypothetical protein
MVWLMHHTTTQPCPGASTAMLDVRPCTALPVRPRYQTWLEAEACSAAWTIRSKDSPIRSDVKKGATRWQGVSVHSGETGPETDTHGGFDGVLFLLAGRVGDRLGSIGSRRAQRCRAMGRFGARLTGDAGWAKISPGVF